MADALCFVEPSPALTEAGQLALRRCQELAETVGQRRASSPADNHRIESARRSALAAIDLLEKQVLRAPPNAKARALGVSGEASSAAGDAAPRAA